MGILELMAAPFAECLVLVAIHTYLGLHVLRRRVIFVDLALAQIAALGTTVGFLFGIMPETPGSLVFSLLFAFVGAAVFSITRFRHERVPQEAVIGLTYAVSFALAVLVVDKTRGAEHLKDVLVGNLLWVSWQDVGFAAVVYLGVGLLHYRFRKPFLAISDDPEAAYRAGLRVRAWDFLFYLTFGVVITLSTRVAGVLLVFVFLVAPAILALLVTQRFLHQLLIGWGTGTAVTVVGLYLSWALDLPSGPAVIVFYGLALVLGSLALFVARAPDRIRAMKTLAVGTAAAACAGWLLWWGGTRLGASRWAVSADARAVDEEIRDERAALAAREGEKRQHRMEVLRERTKACVGQPKLENYLAAATYEERLLHTTDQLRRNRRRGLEWVVLVLADDETSLLYREEAVTLLREAAGRDFGYDATRGAGENEPAIAKACAFVRALKRSDGRDEPDPGEVPATHGQHD